MASVRPRSKLCDFRPVDPGRLWMQQRRLGHCEIERRVTELDSGTVSTVPWPEVRQRLFE
jgi:hypothetical protein